MSVTIYHNPRCSKSREALKIIRDKGIEPEVIEYLEDPPHAARLARLVKEMGKEPEDIVRRKEANDLGIDIQGMDNMALLKTMSANPKLIERPIVWTDKGVRVCRPPEIVEEIL